MSSKPLIHVVDDDSAVRESVEFLLDSAGFAVQLFDGAQPLLDALDHIASGCVLSDIRMPGIDGLELLRRIRASGKPLPVVLMTAHGDVALAVEAMKLGATDFIEKPFDDEDLLRAVRSALEPPAAAPADPALQDFVLRLDRLSQRERQVFERLVAGDPNKVIARRLEISPRTVEIYRANVMTKMQASSISELVRSAVRAGLA